jgi:tripartite-type tricarboxylate transporter receptor subunit TctC
MNGKRRQLCQCMLGCAAARLAPDAATGAEKAWPRQAVKLLVGFAAGSSPDATARALADPLAQALGQPVIVENRPGASGNIAADLVAKAVDDHTLGIIINGNVTSAKMLNPQLPYDPARDFSFLSLLTAAPLVLVAPASLPSGAAFLAEAARSADRWSYGSPGNGSLSHLGMEWLKSRLPGLRAVHVPYQSNPAVLTGLLGGQIQLALLPPGIAAAHIRSGKLHLIGVTGGRTPLVPEAVPLSELGVRDFNLEVWNGLVAPTRLPLAAQQRLAQLVPDIMRTPQTRQRLFQQGWQVIGSSPEGLRKRVGEEAEAMARIIRATGVRVE